MAFMVKHGRGLILPSLQVLSGVVLDKDGNPIVSSNNGESSEAVIGGAANDAELAGKTNPLVIVASSELNGGLKSLYAREGSNYIFITSIIAQ